MRFAKTLCICLKCILILTLFLSSNVCVYAQLKKTAKIEKVKSFTNGSVILNKTTVDGVEVYSVTLPNNSKYYQMLLKEEKKVKCLTFPHVGKIINCLLVGLWDKNVSKFGSL